MWKHEIPVYSNVIYFHPRAGRNDTGLYTQQWDGYEYRLRYKVIRLIEREGEAILEMQAQGLLFHLFNTDVLVGFDVGEGAGGATRPSHFNCFYQRVSVYAEDGGEFAL